MFHSLFLLVLMFFLFFLMFFCLLLLVFDYDKLVLWSFWLFGWVLDYSLCWHLLGMMYLYVGS